MAFWCRERLNRLRPSPAQSGLAPSRRFSRQYVDAVTGGGDTRLFARDVLSIVIQGPTRPQMTVVDLPGFIQANTKGINTPDRQMVEEITERYIGQPRTICLAVIAAKPDYIK
ncbi:uncharacterized protein HMPREF1541_05874 [Cyphellophora europaea CBS 101466]|uniref:Dynamin N-terminal domain-containing protein n=1 Tax=Cyphellophora europaea (strain CBS 101466) TaxID=1220924 RepID=W2RV47_CYPE1|nr:uncharacterized protein HMPREF1541_05874 [Cyphellophora europaea CBS 101466]ETN39648.1 hypothetical protein HMPREF1541_05874 [Cyphellophora europaea CBS 101466]